MLQLKYCSKIIILCKSSVYSNTTSFIDTVFFALKDPIHFKFCGFFMKFRSTRCKNSSSNINEGIFSLKKSNYTLKSFKKHPLRVKTRTICAINISHALDTTPLIQRESLWRKLKRLENNFLKIPFQNEDILNIIRIFPLLFFSIQVYQAINIVRKKSWKSMH